jgi:hypothetical protein
MEEGKAGTDLPAANTQYSCATLSPQVANDSTVHVVLRLPDLGFLIQFLTLSLALASVAYVNQDWL